MSVAQEPTSASSPASLAEPYTVYRTWLECSTLSLALSSAFAGMPGLPKLGPSARGLGFMKGGVSDEQREAVLDKFMCRLFGMPAGVRECAMVTDFFGARNGDGRAGRGEEEVGSPSSVASPAEGGWGEVRGASDEGGISFSDFLTKIDTTTPPSRSPAQRGLVFPSANSSPTGTPAPSIRAKASNASLRTQRYDSLTSRPVQDSPDSFVRPLILSRAATASDVTAGRGSRHSARTSASSSSSVTATPHNLDARSRSSTPMARSATAGSPRSSVGSHRPPPLALARTESGKPSPLGLPELAAAVTSPKKPKLLRAVRSLGDLRKIKDLVAPTPVPALPTQPTTLTASDLITATPRGGSPKGSSPGPSPKPFGLAMLRQLSGPLSPAAGLGSAAMGRGFSKGSQSNQGAERDDEELWGTSTEYFAPQPVSAGFREAPNGRLESMSRRPSVSRAPTGPTPRAYYHQHKSSLSGSSLASARSGLSSVDLGRSVSDRGGYCSSARTSADFSVSDRSSVGHAPSTPPTPGSGGEAALGVSMGRYREVDGRLVQNQSFVVQQPFYCLPPPAPMAGSRSCDLAAPSTGVRSHTRKSSLEQPHRRARVSSSASLASMQLGTILASPNQASFPRAQLDPPPSHAPAHAHAHAPEFVEFKLRHPKDTFRKRFATAGLDYAGLRRLVLEAFEGSEARLGEAEGGWGLVYTSTGEGRVRMVNGEGAFGEMMRGEGVKGRVVLTVVSA